MFSLSAPNACALLFSACFFSSLALAAAARSGGIGFLILELSKFETRLEAMFAFCLELILLLDFCLESSFETRGLTTAAFGGLEAILNMDGPGLW